MTARQYFLKTVYPLLMFRSRFLKRNQSVTNSKGVKPLSSFHDLKFTLINGEKFYFNSLKGYKVLIVNTASNCGYTAQYAELEELYNRYKTSFKVLGFPSNDFKQQEQGDDASVETFCKLNYGISFSLMQKSHVLGENQNHIYQWLTKKEVNGWNNILPEWNFSKYLISEDGILLNYFPPFVSPLSRQVLECL